MSLILYNNVQDQNFIDFKKISSCLFEYTSSFCSTHSLKTNVTLRHRHRDPIESFASISPSTGPI